jgi:hypothetical protein
MRGDVKLRNAHLAVIDRGKVLDYLLNEAHPDNGGKARFFASLWVRDAVRRVLLKPMVSLRRYRINLAI